MRPVSKIFLDITKSAGAGGIQFLITLVTTPMMTRLYAPEAYAVFGILYSMATLTINIGMLSLQHAYITEKNAAARSDIMQTMLLLLGCWFGLAVLAAMGMAMLHIFHVGAAALLFFPLVVLTYGMRHLLVAVAIARAHFSSTALGQAVEPVCSRGGAVAFGALFGGHPAFMLVAVVFGQLLTVWMIARMVLGSVMREWRALIRRRTSPLAVLRRYSDFVVYNTFSHQMFSLVLLGIQTAIALRFSPHVAGQYMLATSIVMLPGTLVALTTAPVVYRHFIDVQHVAPERLARHLAKAAVLYLLAAVLILSPLIFFGEPIFSIVFGSVWAQSGAMAQSLSLGYLGSFAVIGVQSIFTVTRRLKMQFTLEVLSCVFVLIVTVASVFFADVKMMIFCLSGVLIFRNVVLLIACFIAVYRYAPKRVECI